MVANTVWVAVTMRCENRLRQDSSLRSEYRLVAGGRSEGNISAGVEVYTAASGATPSSSVHRRRAASARAGRQFSDKASSSFIVISGWS